MKRSLVLKLTAAAIILAATSTVALADIHFDVGIGLPGVVPPPVYYGPPPVYYSPPPPVYYGPGVVYGGGGYDYGGERGGPGWAHDRWHGGDWHDRGGWRDGGHDRGGEHGDHGHR